MKFCNLFSKLISTQGDALFDEIIGYGPESYASEIYMIPTEKVEVSLLSLFMVEEILCLRYYNQGLSNTYGTSRSS